MAPVEGGWTGGIVDVDLTSGEIKRRDGEHLLRRYLGGGGLGQSILFSEIQAGTTALDPENIVVISAGPLTGTAAPTSCRLNVDSMNVLTGGVNSSNAGGHFAPELKFAGLDALIVRGRSAKPVYIEIVDGRVRLVDASRLWGKTTWDTEDAIRAEMRGPKAHVMTIGPAGENLVGAACIIVDRARAAGRGGIGAVLGSKHLKAVAVRGHLPVQVAQPDAFAAEVDRALAMLENENTRNMRRYGTFASMPTLNKLSRVAYRNFQDDYIDPKRIEPVSADIMVDRYRVRKLGCFNCPLVCSNYFAVESGEYAGTRGEGLHENHMENFVSRFDMNDPAALLHMQSVCSTLGLDIDNAAVAVSWAFECFEQELISVRDTGGLELRWGDAHAIIKVLHQLAHREGIGELLAQGIKKASEKLGPEAQRLAVTCKGQELMETVRVAKGWGFGVIVAARGGTHLEGAPRIERWNLPTEYVQRKFGHPDAGNPATMEGKPEAVYWTERFKAAVDALGICYLATEWGSIDNLDVDTLAALFSAATGQQTSGDDLLAIGDRITNLKKAFNTLHRGFARQDDMPPARFLEEPVRGGQGKEARLDAVEWSRALDQYYALHGWDPATGWQTARGLHALGMDDVATKLAAAAKLLP